MKKLNILTLALSLLLVNMLSFVNVKAIDEVEISNFENLKSEIQKGGEQIIVLKNDIIFSEQIVLPANSNITIKDDGNVRKLILDQTMAIDDSSKYGKGMILVSNGANLILNGSTNENLVFDGNRDKISTNLDISDNGLFLTAADENSIIKIKHASFMNSKNRGGKTAPILAKDKATVIIDDILIKNNVYNQQQTMANYKFRDFDENTQTAWSAKGSALAVQGGAKIIFNNGIIEENGLFNYANAFSDENIKKEIPDHNSDHAAISVFGQESKIIINDGIFRNNSGGVGGVLAIISGAEAIINGGIFENNKAILRGGAIVAYSSVYNVQDGSPVLNPGNIVSKVTINGGAFINNKAYKMGGGAIFTDWNTKLEINSGKFENNQAPHGGAVAIGDRWRNGTDDGGSILNESANEAGFSNYTKQWKWRSKALINGGEFINNKASETGGAIYINSSDVKINAAKFENNESQIYGGAIYLASVPHKLQLKNTYFENNQAISENKKNIIYKHYNQTVNLNTGVGGAIWYCPTGNTEFYVSNSAAFNNNKAVTAGDDYASVTKLSTENTANADDPDIKGQNFLISVENRMLGGGYIKWYKDGSNNDTTTPRYSENNGLVENISNIKEEILLKAVSLESAQNLAKANAKILFINNKSARGGAVATNGTLIIGEKDKKFDLKIIKNWDEKLSKIKDKDDTSVTVELYNVTNDNKEFLIDELVLNKKNNYQGTFKNLPLEANDKKIIYKIREKEGIYNVSYDNTTIDTNNVNNNQEIIINILNKPKDTPSIPDRPIIPDIPTAPNNPPVDNPTKDKVPDTGINSTINTFTFILISVGNLLLLKK